MTTENPLSQDDWHIEEDPNVDYDLRLRTASLALDEAQPQKQTGFRQGFIYMDHIHTVSRVTEVCQEYRLPLVLTFVDYEKAFDSEETNAILSELVHQETMLNELNEAAKRVGPRINRKKTQFMKNTYCENGVELEGSQMVETSLYVYLGRSVNMETT
ncbi:hypothetical protein RB195_022502 [Necator americanus]|uniref:Reverse transcriptase domain-containing protein n=1 Tax=Necator americanus TaxID=51031 RepID=A0ABR1EFQ5_NECAM